MFARVITAQAGAEGFDNIIGLAERQLPSARQRPGFQGFYLLADDETGKLINISFWETREHIEEVARGTAGGIHDQGVEATGLASLRLETYEVKMHAWGIAPYRPRASRTRPTAVAMTRPPLTCLRPQGPYDSPGNPCGKRCARRHDDGCPI